MARGRKATRQTARPAARQATRVAGRAFDAITVEGALIAPAMLARIADRTAGEQKDADYRIPKGLALRDEVARYFRIGQALYADLAAAEAPSHKATIEFLATLLRDVFGFADIARTGRRTRDDRLFAVTLEGTGGRVPVTVVPPEEGLDTPSDHLPTDGRRGSAGSALQDWLNAEDDALWGLAGNGRRLRLMRDNASFTRPAHIEADLHAIFEDEAFADFTALWLLLHASRFGRPGSPVTDCALERWREAGGREGVAARDRLRDGVEQALLSLGDGFLADPDNTELRRRIAEAELSLQAYFGQLLRLVYRLIFLFAAEDRNLLHPPDATAAARRLYAEGYSLRALRDRAVRRAAWDRHHDRWEGLHVVFRSLAGGERRLGLPALGGLFVPGTIADLEGARLANRDLMAAFYRLAWLRDAGGLAPVNWRDMETEELGSVYESLLELTPRLREDGRGFAFTEGGTTKGNERKTTGSYYTPDSLVETLLDSALDPVLDRIAAEAEDPAAALLAVTVVDPACGSGHFLLAAARRIANRVARARAGEVATAEQFRHALRDVLRACIFGVDRNPLAVELAKVALWIESVDPGKPLTLLDNHIRCGDSLVGVFDLEALRDGIPDNAYKPLPGDGKDTARYYRAKNSREIKERSEVESGLGLRADKSALSREFAALQARPENSLEDIESKRRLYESLQARGSGAYRLKIACDLWMAAWLAPREDTPRRGRERVPTSGQVWEYLRGVTLYGPMMAEVDNCAHAHRFFHWPIEFPDIMAEGGFDVVLGNPPWDVLQLSEGEYFAQRLTEIAELAGAARKRAIAALEHGNPAAYAAYQSEKRRFKATNGFARHSGRFDLTARGKVNSYALFAELFADLASSRGQAGVIVPTGIATDATTAPFFGALVDRHRLASLIDFENRDAIFPAVHRSYKFSLLTIGRDVDAAGFAFFLTDPAQLAHPERRFTLSPEQIARINPNTKTAPVFRSRADAELTAKIYANLPVLIEEGKGAAGNPWGMEFRQGLFNMTSDSGLFRTAQQLRETDYERDGTDWVGSDGRYVPLYEAKMINFFDHRFGTYEARGEARGYRVLPETSKQQYENPSFEPQPYYFVPEEQVLARLPGYWRHQWLNSFKDVTASTNERTTIFSFIPVVGVGHTAPLIFPKEGPNFSACLIGNLNSLLLDYCARNKVSGLHLTYGYLKQLPVLPPSAYTDADLAFIVPRVLALTYTSHAMAPFARDLGHDGPPFAWDAARRAWLRAELDAWYARAYGLSRDELRYILDPADVKSEDYPSETFRVLKKNEIKRFGEYRTARLVLQAWDEQAAANKKSGGA